MLLVDARLSFCVLCCCYVTSFSSVFVGVRRSFVIMLYVVNETVVNVMSTDSFLEKLYPDDGIVLIVLSENHIPVHL